MTGIQPQHFADGVSVLRKPFREIDLVQSIKAALNLSHPEASTAFEEFPILSQLTNNVQFDCFRIGSPNELLKL